MSEAVARTPVRTAALVVGVVFLLVGTAGFIPGLTSDLDAMQFAGHHSGALLFGVFAVSVLHNAVHLAFGVWGVAASRSVRGASLFLVGGGVIYLVVWLYGLLAGGTDADVLPLNAADNWLHLGLGLGMAATGLVLARRASPNKAGADWSA
ncbi:DUF4383 domain-containing protein [Actinosynnema sp. NPDC050436]|uniref:DUF4383 domain-containing protein n=1 Tax=Actinosynnema sp. NPDC050436 TaxID=3155659 RepID=UPI0033FED543